MQRQRWPGKASKPLGTGSVYESTNGLDAATTQFNAPIERDEVVALLKFQGA